jgi:hypothetical protein
MVGAVTVTQSNGFDIKKASSPARLKRLGIPVRAVAGQAKAIAPSVVPQYHRQAGDGFTVPAPMATIAG